ncbi:MAG: hypothetical protein JNK76_18400 [Planctomycetales bacterium]|nr:hypothetical protein [Planctomycetales bacterium]MBN8625493.1 hypothetical protein [Planctomycetota bacterium]
MANVIYNTSVERLLTLGDEPIRREPTPGYYAELGLTLDDADELRRMILDDRLHEGPWDDDRYFFAPLHAWRALVEFGCGDALDLLLRALDDDPEDEWLNEELAHTAALLGESALPRLVAAVRDERRCDYARQCAASALGKLGTRLPELRAECVAHLAAALEAGCVAGDQEASEQFSERRAINGCIVGALIDLRAIETGETIRQAYEAGAVAEFFCGDWPLVEAELQLPPGINVYGAELNGVDSPELRRYREQLARRSNARFVTPFAYDMSPEERERLREQRKKEAKAATRAKQKAKAAKMQKKRNRK